MSTTPARALPDRSVADAAAAAHDLSALHLYAVLVEAGSFTRAADRLGCTKGHVSKQLAALERSLGMQLLHRSTRRLAPTAAGSALLPLARRLTAVDDEVRQVLDGLRDDIAGTVRVSVPVSLGETCFDDIVVGFCRQYPRVHIALDLSNGIRDLVADGIDFALRSGSEPAPDLIARPLYSMEEYACASPAYLAAAGTPLAPADLAAHACLQNLHFGEEAAAGEWEFHRGAELWRVPVRGPLACNHYSLLKKAAIAGAGIARLPGYLIDDELADGRLLRLLPDYESRRLPIFLVYAPQRTLPQRTRVLIDYVREWFAGKAQRCAARRAALAVNLTDLGGS